MKGAIVMAHFSACCLQRLLGRISPKMRTTGTMMATEIHSPRAGPKWPMSRDVARAVLVVTQRMVPVSVVARNHSGRSRRRSASRAEGIPSLSLGRMMFGSEASKAISPPEKIPSRAMHTGMSIMIQRSLMALPFPQHHPDTEDPRSLDLANHETQTIAGDPVTPCGQPAEEMEHEPAYGPEILRGNG